MNALDILQIEHACAKLSTLYANCLDTFEDETTLSLFAPDGVWNHMSKGPLVGRGVIGEFLASRDRASLLRHIVSNCEVTVISETRATGRSYWTAYIPTAGEAGELPTVSAPASVGAYDDEYVFVDGAWRFATRTMKPLFRGV